MQVFILTHAEAANGEVWRNLQQFLQAQGADAGRAPTVFHNEAVPASVQPIGQDAPDVGTPPAAEVFGVGGDLPQQVFGQVAAPLPQTLGEVSHAQLMASALPPVPSTAGVGQWPTAPAALPLPLNPGAAQTDANQTHAATPAPAAPAPLAPAAPMSHAGGVEVDSEGLPWDARIHSGGKKKNAGDGRWTAKRGINDPALVERVKAELRGVMSAGVPSGSTPVLGQTAPMPQTVAAPPLVAGLPNVPPSPPPLAAPQASAPATPAAVPPLPNPGTVAPSAATVPGAVPGGETFAQFMQRLAPYTAAGSITPEAIARAGAHVGVGLPMLQNRPDLIPAFAQALGLPAQ